MRSDVQANLKILNGMFSGNRGRGWINWFLKISLSLRGGLTSSVCRSAVVCVRMFYKWYASEGVKGLVLRTKSLYVLLMQAHAGHRIQNTRSLGPGISRTNAGYPRVIPSDIRRRIKHGDTFLLRLWLSWFSIYRVLEFPSTLKLGTITEPGVHLSDALVKELLEGIRQFCVVVLKVNFEGGRKLLPAFEIVPLTKTTPSISKGKSRISWSPAGILQAWASLRSHPVYASFLYIANELYPTPTDTSLTRGLGWTEYILKLVAELDLAGVAWDPAADTEFSGSYAPIGKVGLKREAAGKVRVFAMVECWTQWLLHPIHTMLFTLLGKLPTDGTHDQMAPVNRLIESGLNRFWCYDLSAATDRLPVVIQSWILDFLFGKSIGRAWANLLVGRSYDLPAKLPKGVLHEGTLPQSVSYAVGQPMGALSSWAMLAITHHFLVHLAAKRVGYQWGTFWLYAVLGDDIVIAEGRVAGSYLQIMSTIGVGIGLHKSLVSRKGVLEFAKRYIVRTVDSSPIPFKEIVAAIVDFEQSTEFVRKYSLGSASIAALLGYGYRVKARLVAHFDALPKKLRTLGIWRVSPWGVLPQNIASWLNITSFVIRPEWLVQTTEMWPATPISVAAPWVAWVQKESKRLERLQKDLPRRGTVYSASWMMKWLDNLIDIPGQKLKLLKITFPTKAGNVLWAIQYSYWKRTVPLLFRDLNKYSDQLFKWKTGSDVPDWKLKEWVAARLQGSNISKPKTIGEKARLKDKPSILFPTRLWKSIRNSDVTTKL